MTTKRRKVLVIDDSETILDFTREALEDAGYDVVTLTSAALFPATLNREKPDLALIDVAMPVVDGQSLVSLARRNQLHHCVIALYSGQPEEKLKWMTASCGADAYLRKSSDAGDLLRHVEQLLRMAPAPVAAASPAKAPRPDGETVVVVQSGPVLPMELEQAIRACRCTPQLCTSSGECLAALGQRPHLACLVDFGFESRRGEALCQAIKEQPVTSSVPVIMVGAESSSEVMASWRAGADDFLPHPVKAEQLTGKLELLRAAKRAAPVAIRERSRQVVLLVAPGAALRGRLGTMLEMSGYGLMYARSAAEAHGLLDVHASAVSAAVVDVDGAEGEPGALLAQLRRRFRGPLLALTAREAAARDLKDPALQPFEVVNSQLALELVVKRVNNSVHLTPADLQAHLRVPFFSVVEFRPSNGLPWKSGISFDLSPAGLFVRTLTPEPKGTLLDLELQLTAFGARATCSGVVAWSNPYAGRGAFSYPVGMGVQLIGLKPDVSAQIGRILRAVTLGGFPAGGTQAA